MASELVPELTINGLYNLNLSLRLPLLQLGWNSYGFHTPRPPTFLPMHSCFSYRKKTSVQGLEPVLPQASFPFLHYCPHVHFTSRDHHYGYQFVSCFSCLTFFSETWFYVSGKTRATYEWLCGSVRHKLY